MTKIKTLKEKNELFYPQTHINAVVDDNGDTMGKLIDNIEKKIPTKISHLENDVKYAELEDTFGDVDIPALPPTTTVEPNIDPEGTNAVQAQAIARALEEAVQRGRELAKRDLYIAAGAEYNDTGSHIIKDTPWKNYVDIADYKAQWDLDVVTGSVQTLTYGGKTYEYVDDNGTWKIIARVGEKLIWDDTKVIHRAGYYYLNGLGDITESQMMEIYDYTFPLTGASDWSSALRRNLYTDNFVRTNLLKKDFYANNKIKVLSGAFYYSVVEVVRLTGSNNDNWGVAVGANASQTAFNHTIVNATKLRYILGIIDFKNQKTDSVYFGTGASSINVLRIKNLVGNFVSFGNSKTISKSSVLYIIQNAIPTSAITITLHPDAYTRLAEDADIVTALEEKNTSLSGTSGSIGLVSA